MMWPLCVEPAQSGNVKMCDVAESKLLNFNLDKSGFTVFGSKQRRLEIQSELEGKPLASNIHWGFLPVHIGRR